MTPYYKDQLNRGLIFQDFIYEILSREGIMTVSYGSKLFQQRKGENKARMEIKFDGNMHTGNLYIEIAEKSDPKNADYIESGIYRSCTEYVIGNYNTIFRLPTSVLRLVHKTGRYKEVEIKLKTSKGFLYPQGEASRIAIAVYHPNCDKEVKRILAEDNSSRIQRRLNMEALMDAMKCDPAQLKLFENSALKDVHESNNPRKIA